jgi:outer membrane protein
MRKVILSLTIATLVTISVNAQTEKGYWLLGGSALFSTNSETVEADKLTGTDFTIAPTAGYFIIDNLAVGAGIAYLTETSKSSSPDNPYSETTTMSVTSFAFGPFVRYYFLPIGKNAKLFANGTLGFGSGSQKENGQSIASTSSTVWQIAAGPSFFLNKHTSVEVALSYGANTEKEDGEKATENTFQIEVGFQIHFKGNHK